MGNKRVKIIYSYLRKLRYHRKPFKTTLNVVNLQNSDEGLCRKVGQVGPLVDDVTELKVNRDMYFDL